MKTLAMNNPRSGKEDFNVPVFSQQEVADIAKTLRKNHSYWWQIGIQGRIKVMLRFADELANRKDALVAALVNDTGRLSESVLEVDVTVSTIQRWCKQAPPLLDTGASRLAEIPFIELQQRYLPYTLVGAISPWNFPLLLSLVDIIPALLAGSAVLLKPSEVTSRFVEPLQKVINLVPELQSVFAVVTGAGDVGQAVLNEVDSLCFTGSVPTGRKVGEACAKRFIPAFLELGGKDAAIVCANADLDIAAKALCWGSMVNAGQSCMSLERTYVHKDVAQAFLTKLVDCVKQLKHNYPDLKAGQVGPIISASQVGIVKAQLSDAKAKGAKVLCGGEVVELGGGQYCQPTVLTNVSPDMKIMNEETFAAILVVNVVDSDEEAIKRANDSEFGLSAAVFSKDVDYAMGIAEKLEVGGISINDASLTGLIHEAEKQSFKYSGLGGSRMGAESIRRFIRKKAIIRNTGVPSPWWF
ncbi:aldehyde dehydrogenase [Glaciecola punicea]|jgi:acyl-CoA reductase-like NAD-dependent aldehyde dehydrogenase|uniref:aldehyde dehydrogenase family protein n=1 Tax=Glaciecola punicea TaxID=56804 RepID=UPI0008728936|nr:aldehyde dehydrogenase family protein [Glaciecola punicea]OFA29853.1 aldehyde dehydrogenase [Glaciecola punicea]